MNMLERKGKWKEMFKNYSIYTLQDEHLTDVRAYSFENAAELCVEKLCNSDPLYFNEDESETFKVKNDKDTKIIQVNMYIKYCFNAEEIEEYYEKIPN